MKNLIRESNQSAFDLCLSLYKDGLTDLTSSDIEYLRGMVKNAQESLDRILAIIEVKMTEKDI